MIKKGDSVIINDGRKEETRYLVKSVSGDLAKITDHLTRIVTIKTSWLKKVEVEKWTINTL